MAQEISRSSAAGAGGAGVQTAGVRACPGCGAGVNVNATVCAACGERMPTLNRTIRCRRCRSRANASLVICPHCGRDLQPARPRWLIWGAPLALLLCFGLFVMLRSNPVAWAQARVAGLGALMGSISDQLDPEVNIVFVPPDTDAEDPLASQAALAVAAPTTPGEGAPPPAQPEAPATEVIAPADTPTATAAAVAATAATSTPEATAADALELPTPTPSAGVYRVQRGDTVFDIALRYGVTEEELLAANDLTARDAFTLQPGRDLIIPGADTDASAPATPTEAPSLTPTATPPATSTPLPTATPASTATPTTTATTAAVLRAPTAASTPTVALQTYTVRAGDTLAAIAIRNGVTIDSILTANNLTLAQGRQLRAGQQLLIPQRAAPDAALQLPTATPVAVNGSLRLAAPTLREPADGATLPCASNATLSWEPAPGILPDDMYVVHLGYVDADDAVVWVAQPQRAATVSAWEVDAALCELPPATASGAWQWWVEVVAGTGAAQAPVSPPSEIRSFVWR